jgi:PST family polysaccharide transporter
LVSRRADDFLIGLLLGDFALGIYAVAYRGLQILEQVLAKTGSVVALPAFSRLQGQPERLRVAFYQSIRVAGAIAMPVFVGVAIVAPLAVPIIFGEQYEQSGDVLAVLALVGVVHSVSYLDYAVYVGVGRPDIVLKLLAVRTLANVILFVLVARWGIVAVATAYVGRAYVLWPLNLWALRLAAGVSPRSYVANLMPAMLSCVVMAAAIWAVSQLPLGDVGLLLTCVLVGAIVYVVAMYRVAPRLMKDLRSKLGLFFRS